MTGPCSHCGIGASLIWRPGPPDKPVLCCNCEIWWRLNGSLRTNISQFQTNNSAQNNIFPKLSRPAGFSRGVVFAINNTQTQLQSVEEAATRSLFWNPWNSFRVLKKKRSMIEQQYQQQQQQKQRGVIMGKKIKQENAEEEFESVLIFERVNKNIPENEISHGCMLLKPSASSSSSAT